MDSIRLQRLRCLSDTGDIAIKPITILVGQNSSGKSSFLRFFPLLRQSVESRLSGPILWNGRLVDFGNYENAHQDDSEEGICFSFRFKVESDKSKVQFNLKHLSFLVTSDPARVLDDVDIDLTVKLVKRQKKEQTITNQIILNIADSQVRISAQEDGKVTEFCVNSLDILKLGYNYKIIDLDESSQDMFLMFPRFIGEDITLEDEELKLENKNILMNLEELRLENEDILMNLRVLLSPSLLNHLKEHIEKIDQGSTSQITVTQMVSMFGVGTSEKMFKNIKENIFMPETWKDKTKDWTLNDPEFIKIRDLIIAIYIPYWLDKCGEKIEQFSRNIKYMGPVRARGERYHKMQDLAVDEIDYQGENLAVFLQNLTDEQREKFQDWTLRNFEFTLQTKSAFGLISVEIQPKNSRRSFNLVDMGFGFSQMLPIITQLWFIGEYPQSTLSPSIFGRNRRNNSPILFAIEQSESQLHPRLQGILTDVFVNSIKETREKNIDLRLIIETHSEVLINRLGYLVEEKMISPDDINIVLFEPDEQGKTIVKTTQFNENGYLKYWPLGFLEPDYNAD